MKLGSKPRLFLAALGGVGLMAAGCADEHILADNSYPDFGRAVHEDLAAQIADPDAVYKGPPPPSNGARAELAQKRYETDTVRQPVSQSTQSGGGGGGASGGGGGGGGGSPGGGAGGGGPTGP